MYHLNGPTHTEASEEGRKEGLAAACGLFCGLYPSIVYVSYWVRGTPTPALISHGSQSSA